MKNLIFIIALGLFSSCNVYASGNLDWYRDAMEKLRTVIETPDSLRSEEQSALLRGVEMMLTEGLAVENNRFVLIISRKEWKEKNLPEVFYYAFEKDITSVNHFIDTNPTARETADLERDLRVFREQFLKRMGFQN